MKLACFVLMRNEKSILNPFVDQLREFFDHVALIDHASDDGSLKAVKNNLDERFRVCHLEAGGYPQSQIATGMTKIIFAENRPDWLFFLDCDEFLPFNNRSDLEQNLSKSPHAQLVYMNWRNIVPDDLGGGNIFGGRFKTLTGLSRYRKIALSRSAIERHPALMIQQGYHGVSNVEDFEEVCLSSDGLYHIPVQSRAKFVSKISTSAHRLIGERHLLSKGLGAHWVKYFEELQIRGVDNFDFESAGLGYPDLTAVAHDKIFVDFRFPYIKSPYEEGGSLETSKLLNGAPARISVDEGFRLMDSRGLLLIEQPAKQMVATPQLKSLFREKMDVGTRTMAPSFKSRHLSTVELYSTLFEPLFSLPLALPTTAWGGHIPFLFALFKMMRPNTYVELGVHHGASLISAATAATAYHISTKLFGIDSWAGDDHAGLYQGDKIFADLKKFVDGQFDKVELMRCFFDEAVMQFPNSSIDILHIDGLHSYDAVKNDFENWFPKVSLDGVVLLHDTTVKERGFGVYQLWAELEREYSTLQFFHSHGLGIVFKDAKSPRVAPLLEICQSAETMSFYQMLVSDVGSLIKPRMNWLDGSSNVENSGNLGLHTALKERDEELKAAQEYGRALELKLLRKLPWPYRFRHLS